MKKVSLEWAFNLGYEKGRQQLWIERVVVWCALITMGATIIYLKYGNNNV